MSAPPGAVAVSPPEGGSGAPCPGGAGAAPRRGARSRRALAAVLRPSMVVWLTLGAIILLPVGAFLIQGVSPRLFSQGTAWFTLANVTTALKGQTLHGFIDSLWVSVVTAVGALAIGTAVAWLVHRSNLPGRRAWPLCMWALLLMPTYLMADGWQYLLQPDGVAQRLGLHNLFAYHAIFGPFGVVLILTLSGLPFAYLVMSAALRGLGQEFEDAARVHGASPSVTARAILPILAPAMLSAVAIVFAESMSDFGVSSTLAFQSHFPMATYGLFTAIDNNPANFGVAAVLGGLLVASAAIPIAIQSRVLRGRSYAVLSGRSGAPVRRRLRPLARVAGTGAVALLFVVALGVPLFGAVVASLMTGVGTGGAVSHALGLASYRQVFHNSDLAAPLLLSNRLSAITATLTVILGLFVARVISSRRGGAASKVADVALIGSMALPGIVLAAGYIFAFNLPIASRLGINLYETLPLLVMGYIATALPSEARLMVGPMSQVQDCLREAARVHGAGPVRSWRDTFVPIMSRTLLWAWLFSFAKILLELPVSQILYPPGQEPISVSIQNLLGNYHYDVGTAMTVVAVGEMFAVIAALLLAFRLFAPRGWQRVGTTIRGS